MASWKWWCAYNKDTQYRPECIWRWEGHESCHGFWDGVFWLKDREGDWTDDTRDTDRTS